MGNELDGTDLGPLSIATTEEEKAVRLARDEHVAVLALEHARSAEDAIDLLDALGLADAARSWHARRVAR